MAISVGGNTTVQPPGSGRNSLLRRSLLLSAAAAAVIAFAWRHWELAKAQGLLQQLQALQVSGVPAGDAVPRADFVARLGPQIASARFAANVNRALREADVHLDELGFEPRPATAGALRQTEVALTLTGTYAGIKCALNEIMTRHRSAVLQRLTLRRTGPGPQLQAKMQLMLLAAPASVER